MKLFPYVVLLLGVLLRATAIPHPKPSPSEAYLLHEELDPNGKYHVFWKFNSSHITFEIHVQTRGYVGFGLSPNGKMFPSDVVVGWVKDGVTHFSDRHTTDHVQPEIDQSQDWTLLHGEENDFGTMLKFERPLITCDDNDTDIVDDTMRIIYSFHPDDPIDDNNLHWHGATRRGAKSMLLLSTSKQLKLPDDAQTLDLIHKDFPVPTKDTTYHCRTFSLANITTKHHIVQFEAVVQKGHEPFVHHINLYRCPMAPQNFGKEYTCYMVGYDLIPCGKVIAGWAVGSGPFHFPQNVGLPIGEDESHFGYIIEVHYNNPGGVAGLVDNSGIRLTYTSQLRQHDAGILTVGVYESKSQIIPPHYTDFRMHSVMSKDCLNEGLKGTPGEEVNMFAVWHHAHLLGKAIKTEHIRGGVELEPIAVDRHYDFDYQEIRLFRQEVTLRKDDIIRVECTYDSSLRHNVTYGGFSTSEEMCFSFIFYYPRIPLFMSITTTWYDTMGTFQSIAELNKFIEESDWTNSTVRDKFQIDTLNSSVMEQCMFSRPPTYLQRNMTMENPSVPFRPQPPTCPKV